MSDRNVLECIPEDDSDLCEWLENFVVVAEELRQKEPSTYGKLVIRDADLDQSDRCQDLLRQAIANLQSSLTDENRATRHRETTRAEVEFIVRVRAEGIKKNTDVPFHLKQELGIESKPPPALVPPTNLVVVPISSTRNEVSWEGNTNPTDTTLYELSAAVGTDVEIGARVYNVKMEAKAKKWTTLVTTSASSYLHNTNGQADVPAIYRVRAKRGAVVTEWSKEVSINATEE